MPEPRRLLLVCAAALALAGPLAAAPEAVGEQMAQARAAAARGDGIAAEAELRKALAVGASRTDVAAAMGEAALLQGDLVRARQWLEGRSFAPGQEAYGWRMLGRLLRLEGRLVEAGQALDQALQLAPDDPLLWVEIARLRYIGGEDLKAVEAADRAVQLGPEEPRALELQAQLLRDRTGPLAALPLFERALELAPDDLRLSNEYAATLGDAGRAAEMVAVTREVHERNPREVVPFYQQAVIAARAGNVDLARNLFNRTRGQLRDLPAAMLLQGALELEAGNVTMAVELLERLDQRQPANPRVQVLYARALFAVGDFDRLHQRFDGLAARPDASPYLLTLLGRAYERTGNRAAAATLLDRAAAPSLPPILPMAEPEPLGILAARWGDSPDLPAATVPYVRSLLMAGNKAEGGAVAARLLASRPAAADALVLVGDTALVAGAYDQAFAAYDRAALVRYPDWLMLRATEALDKAGRGGEAAAVAARYAAAFPDNHLALRLLAGATAFSGDWPRTRELLEHLNRRTGGRDVRLLADLSLAQLRTGDATAALATAETARRLQRASPVAAQAKGMALAALKREPDAAAALLAKAQRIGGDNLLLQEARGQLRAH